MYMILPSNTPAVNYPNNKSSDFNIPLPTTLFTPTREKWKVGLTQIQLPLTFYNVEQEETVTVEDIHHTQTTLHMEEGLFFTPTKLAGMLSRVGENLFTVKWKDGFRFKVEDEVKRLTFSPNIAKLLGYPQTVSTDMSKDHKGYTQPQTYLFDPWINLKIIFIESELLQSSQVNDWHLPVLQVVAPPHHEFGETFSSAFHPVDFVNIQGEAHSVIRIKIMDVRGERIRFRAGNVVVALLLMPTNEGTTRNSSHRI
jgi:hypothetical protein